MKRQDDTPSFDFGTDPASVETSPDTVEGFYCEVAKEGEPTSRRVTPVMAASAGSEVERAPLDPPNLVEPDRALQPESGRSTGRADQEWHEVPQARFLSWTDAERLAYCAARDTDSAASAEDDEWREFYQQRARMYETMVCEGEGGWGR